MINAVGITWVLKSDQGVGPFKITLKVRRVDVCANWFAKTFGCHWTPAIQRSPGSCPEIYLLPIS